MTRIALILSALSLAGCSTLGGINQQILNSGKPVVMCLLSSLEAYVVQSGLPFPYGQRLPEADALCAKPATVAK
jgi:predicted small secreted protein